MRRSPPVPAPDPLRAFSQSLPMALLRARDALMSRFRPMLRAHDLTEQQWRVLRALEAAAAPLRSGEIGAMTLLSLPSLSRLLKTLETRALVRRSVHADDLRAAQVTLTAKGKRLVATIAAIAERHDAEIAAAIGADDLDALRALLDGVRSRLAGPDSIDEADATSTGRATLR